VDVYCPRCGEPWDLYYVQHEMTSEERRDFWNSKGCPCCINKEVKERPDRALATAVLRDVLGDDVDGIAATLDDLGF